jgi:hypothetical protein
MPLESRKSALSCDLSTLTATGDAEIHVTLKAVMLIRNVYPGSEFIRPESRVKKGPDPGSGSATRNLSIFNLNFFVTKLSEI